jgi:hypothetical protein
VVLLDDVVGKFDLAQHERHVAACVERVEDGLVGTAFVHVYFVGRPFCFIGLSKKRRATAASRLAVSIKSTAFSLLVDSAVEVLPDALDLDVGLFHASAAATGHLYLRDTFSMSGKKRTA